MSSQSQINHQHHELCTPLGAVSVYQRLLGNVSFDDKHVAFAEDFGEKRSLTLGELKLRAHQLGGGLLRIGLKSGDTVMLISPNSIDFVVVLLAAQFAGIRVALADPTYQPAELKHIFTLMEPRKVFAPLILLRKLNFSEIPFDKVVTMDMRKLWQGRMFAHDIMVSPKRAKSLRPQRIQNSNETAYLSFTSNTTGMPTASEHSHINVCAMLATTLDLPGAVLPGDRSVGLLPFFHARTLLLSVHMPIAARTTVYITAGFDPVTFADLVERKSVLHLVPSVLKALATHPYVGKEHFASLRSITCGATPIDADSLANFMTKSEPIELRASWSVSETSVSKQQDMCALAEHEQPTAQSDLQAKL